MKLRKEDVPIALELPVATFRMTEWGNISAAFIELKAGVDASPLLEGLPNDKCPCPHWGYMLSGAIHVTYTDGTKEVCKAGELFYWPAGHTVRVEEDTTFVEFSPRKELKDLYDHLGKKIAAA
ncbi:MAG: cupin domain-containing protein [Candidatus Zixiibacteriota bacterium]